MAGKTSGNLALREKKIIVIEASQKREVQKLRVAAYARVSSDSSDQMNSFSAQVNYYTDLINSKENWTLADIYTDAGITGTSAEKRPDFQRLLSDCRKGRIDRILTKSVSRFARNAKDCLETVRELKGMGVSVYFEEQNIDTGKMSGELLTAMFASLAQTESESISGNMRWSYQKRMQSGTFIPSKLPFGYIYREGHIEVQNEQARIVQRIFSEYLSGKSAETIANGLLADKVPCKYGNIAWNSTTIRYILTNEKYTGNSVWQKYYTTDTLPYRAIINRGEKPSYYAASTHDAIISEDTFRAANELMKLRALKVSVAVSSPHILRKHIYCGKCNSLFRQKIIRRKAYWTCIGHEKKREGACNVSEVPEKEVTSAFLRLYCKLKQYGIAILSQMLANFQTIREHQLLWRLDIVELNKQISDLSRQNQTLAELNKHGLVDPDIFISQTNELTEQLRAAKREKSRLLDAENDEMAAQTWELLAVIDSGPEFLDEFDAELFGELVDKIIVESNDRLRFRLKNGLELTESIERTVR